MEVKLWVIILDIILIIALDIIHLVFYYLIEETVFNNILDTFSSTPLFDFEINSNCGANDNIIFHRWEGRKETTHIGVMVITVLKLMLLMQQILLK